MSKIPENIKELIHFLGLGILGFVSIGAIIKLLSAHFIFEGLFTLLVCLNLWYLAVKKHNEKE